jgi:subtilisin
MADSENKQFVLLPRLGLRARDDDPALAMLTALPFASSTAAPLSAPLEAAMGRHIQVIDTVSENGPKLVELDEEAAALANSPTSPVRALPVLYYDRPDPRPSPLAGVGPAAPPSPVVIECEDGNSGVPVAGASVVAFTNFAARVGDQGTTDATGNVLLQLSGATIERLYVYPPNGYWGAFRSSLAIQPSVTIPLTPVDLSYMDCVRKYYGNSNFLGATGVKVGVIDTGIGPHADLNVVEGSNTVTGEAASDHHDGDIHGTHVAGLIGANGVPPTGLRGLAPGIELHSYRVFGLGASGASNYAILKAMIRAQINGCDIINLSLGGGPYEDIVLEAVEDARNQGMLVVVAAGNGGRSPVSFPAAYGGATAISAMGHESTFPAGSLESADVDRPPASTADPLEFVAGFSNVGQQIAVTGPGVGALSTLPNNGFGPMSGTSMAAPVVAGAATCLLSRDATVFGLPRDKARSDAIERMLQTNCVRRGFGATYEGYGLPDPGVV